MDGKSREGTAAACRGGQQVIAAGAVTASRGFGSDEVGV